MIFSPVTEVEYLTASNSSTTTLYAKSLSPSVVLPLYSVVILEFLALMILLTASCESLPNAK